MRIQEAAALALGIVVLFGYDAALAQRSSTMEERLFLSSNGQRFPESPNGHFIATYKAATPQQCRDICLANKQCRYWYWTVPGRYSRTPETDESCELLAGILKAEPGQGDPGNYAGRVTDRPTTVSRPAPTAAPPAAPPPSVVPPNASLFPLPRAGLELTFQVPSPNDPNAQRYASFKFLGNTGHRAQVTRLAWEGPLDQPNTRDAETVEYVFDETPLTPTGTCQLEASDGELRRIFVGADFLYKRTCNTVYARIGGSGRTASTISRLVERNERVTVPAGTFDAVVVKKTTNSQYTGINAAGVEYIHEFTETEVTSWWVPALGFYVKQQSRSRVIDRLFAPETIDAYRRDGTPLPPRTTDWNAGSPMVAIRVR